MSHARTQIRDKLLEDTLANLSTTKTRVYSQRVYSNIDTPALNILIASEEIEHSTILERKLDRMLTVNIEAFAYDEETLDNINTEVEEAISADTTLGGLVLDALLTSVNIEFSSNENIFGVLTMTYMIHYRTSLTTPQTLSR